MDELLKVWFTTRVTILLLELRKPTETDLRRWVNQVSKAQKRQEAVQWIHRNGKWKVKR